MTEPKKRYVRRKTTGDVYEILTENTQGLIVRDAEKKVFSVRPNEVSHTIDTAPTE